MPDHNLDDLIVEKSQKKKSSNLKGILTIAALFIVVMLIAIMMTKMVLDKNGDENVTEMNQTEEVHEEENSIIKSEISPDLKPQEVVPEEKPVEEPKEQNEANGSDATVNEENDTVVIPKNGEIIVNELDVDEPAGNDADTIPAKEPEPVKPVNTETPEIPNTGIPPFEDTPAPPAVKPESKKEPVVQKRKETQTPKKREADNGRGGSYRIQVGSFTQTPSAQFLQRIKNSGYSYKLQGGKLLVGGYPSKEAAMRALPGVRNKINKEAFIVNMK